MRKCRLLYRVAGIALLQCCLFFHNAFAQQISRDELIFLTPEWKGERFADGRPRVPDAILARMKQVSIEEAWAVLKNAGYGYQLTENWLVINPDSVLVGRAVTAVFMPARPDVWKAIDDRGKTQGKKGKTPGR
ncbi:hypothetical protein ACRQ5D_24535 [Mucilaginibacter sp. P25]|uniref:hypothetical protein n=1 Tax=Mucilaginibacter sp. P25 TaxID=3423945 RepID=UPI003D7B426B